MTPEVVLAAFGYVLAALAAGMWWGERTARRQAENWAATGQPWDIGPASAHETTADPLEEAEKREWEQTVSKIEENLTEELRREGKSAPADEVREEAERMAAKLGGWRIDL